MANGELNDDRPDVQAYPVLPVPDDVVAADPPRRRRWWFVAAVVVLLGCLAGGLVLRFDGDGDGDDRTPAPPVPSAGPTGSATPAPVSEVVYLVTSNGPDDVARVEYTDEDRDIIRRGEVSLPWRHTFRVIGDKPPLVIVAQRKRGGTSPVTCSISLDGKVLTTEIQRGRNAAPQCSA